MPIIAEINDLRRLYQKRVPRMFYDYCESGSWSEQTFRENSSDFERLYFRQRVAVDLSTRSSATTFLGDTVALPLALAPVGMTGMQSGDGEIKAARAAEKFGVPYILSTMSICSIEDVSAHLQKPFWFQLYAFKDWGFVSSLLDRAKAAGCSVLVITVDLQVLGQRHKDIKNGLSAPPKLTLKNILNMMTKPRWCLGMCMSKRRSFGNIVGHVKGVSDMSSLSAWTQEQFDLELDWKKVEKIIAYWGGKVILKGIMDTADVPAACDVGAHALVVSNHGGRQLDGAPSSIRILPEIVEKAPDGVEIYLDSGIRSGQDILKALALGAKGVLIGRSYIYGLGAMGQKGVEKMLDIFHKELDISMALCGRRTIAEIDETLLKNPKSLTQAFSNGV